MSDDTNTLPMKDYSVVFLCPDYLNEYGNDPYIARVSAASPQRAVGLGLREAVLYHSDEHGAPRAFHGDFTLLAVFHGCVDVALWADDPSDQAIAFPFSGFLAITEYKGLETSPVRELTDNGGSWCEPCCPEEAGFWSVYGRRTTGEADCFEDFATQAEAEAFAAQLQQLWPHLRGR